MKATLALFAALGVRGLAPPRLVSKTGGALGRRRLSTVRAAPVDADVFATDSRPVVLYDGVCNMCNFWVNFVLDNDPGEGRLRFAALQSDVGKALLRRAGRSPEDISSIVLVTADEAHIKSDAVLKIGEAIQKELPIARAAPLARLLPRFLSDAAYDVVADNRYNILGKRATCRVSDDDFKSRFLD